MNLPTRLFFALLISKSLASLSASGQSYPYIVDFESANMQPSSKSYARTDTVTIDQLGWVMPGVYLGYALASDFKIGERSCRVRLSNNTSGTPGYMRMIQDLPYGIDSLSFHTAMYGAETGGKLLLEYSLDQGSTWTPAGDTIIVPDSSAPLQVIRDLSLSGNVRIAIRKVESSNARINIDQIRMTNQDTVITDLALQTFFPAGPGINPYTRTLYAVFEDSVVLHVGELRLHAGDGSLQTFNLGPGSSILTAGDTVFLHQLSLEPNESYYVTFDSAAFQNTSGYKVSHGLQDSLSWTFRTGEGYLTGLAESFQHCDSGHLGIFYAWNTAGLAAWACDQTTGSAAAPSVGIYSEGADSASEIDYLISKLPLDLSGMVAPQLHFMEKQERSGTFLRAVLYSTDYRGGDPQDTSVHWQPLLNLEDIDQTGVWTHRQAGLEQLVHQPFFLAFRFSAPAGSAASGWALDSVFVTEYSSTIRPLRPKIPALQVIGEARLQEIAFRMSAEKAGAAEIVLLDLAGQPRHRERIHCQEGSGIYRIYPGTLRPGLYILRVQTEGGSTYQTKASIYR